MSGHTKEYRVRVKHWRSWTTEETVHAESPEQAAEMVEAFTSFEDEAGNKVLYQSMAEEEGQL